MEYIIGVDGGASGTIGVISDEQGQVLHSAQAGAASYIAVGKDDARDALHQVVRTLLEKVGVSATQCKSAVFGLAAVNHPNDEKIYHELIDPLGLGENVHIVSDMVIAWAGSTACEVGVGIIAGTGASVYGVNASGQGVKTLGWDYLLADQGSGYWIGVEGLRAAIKVWDGRLENSTLLDAMIDEYQLNDASDMLAIAYQPEFEKPDIARFAKRVSKCATEGDVVAQTILTQAGQELAQAVCAVIKRLDLQDEHFTVGMIGGTFQAGDSLLKPFKEDILALAPKVTIETAQYPAAIGAAIYAHYQLGTLNSTILENLKNSSGAILRYK